MAVLMNITTGLQIILNMKVNAIPHAVV